MAMNTTSFTIGTKRCASPEPVMRVVTTRTADRPARARGTTIEVLVDGEWTSVPHNTILEQDVARPEHPRLRAEGTMEALSRSSAWSLALAFSPSIIPANAQLVGAPLPATDIETALTSQIWLFSGPCERGVQLGCFVG